MNAGASPRPMVDIRGVHKSYGGDQQVLRGVDLAAANGEVVTLIGRSGAGKSTLLRCVNHLEKIDLGEIRVDGDLIGYREHSGALYELSQRALARQRAQIGMVFQHFNLFSHRTVLENVMSGPVITLGWSKARSREIAQDLLEQVGLANRATYYPRQLSGGQQQRVAIARALAMQPKVMLFDEPTSALDPQLVGEVLDVIRRLADTGMTMLIVTHELRFAREVSDVVVFMEDGHVKESGPASQVLDDPVDPATRRYLSPVPR